MTVPKTLEKIGRYQVLERVGKGGMGVLYRGFDPVLDREVAIKLMHADFSEDTEQMRPRFYREARAAAKLNHRNIVTIFEFAEESNVPYIVMEFLRGQSLTARMAAVPALTLDDKLNVIAQLCEGLSYAHEQGVVHRDVKPDNVFILEDGQVKLLDFGIAKLTSSTLTRQGDVLGSASYMSPEQVGGSESVDGRADVFSTGVVLYELLCGRKPFEGDSPTVVIVKILKEEPTPITTHAPTLPPEVVAIVAKALQKDPANRYPSAEALGRELQSVRKGLHPSLSNPRMDETRFASTQVMRALHDDFKKAGGAGNSSPKPLSSPDDAEMTRAVLDEKNKKSNTGVLVGAGVGVLLLAAGGYFMMSGGSTPPATTTATTTASTATPAASTPPPSSTTTTTPAATPGTLPSSTTTPGSTPSTPGATTDAAPAPSATTRPARPTTPAPPPTPTGPTVTVDLSGGYPFEVFDGSRSISAAKTSHELKQPAGKALRLVSNQYFLNQTVRVEGSATQPFVFEAPGLGSLSVRSPQETCEVAIGSRKLGNPPLEIKEIAAGNYKIDIVCGTGDVVASQYTTIRAGAANVAAIR